MHTKKVCLLMLAALVMVCGLAGLALAKGSPPVKVYCELTSPDQDSNMGDIVEIRGSAGCLGFDHFVLRYLGRDDPDWTVLCISSDQVRNGLLFTWDTTDFAERDYWVRLDVYSKKALMDYDQVQIIKTKVPCGDLDGDFDSDWDDVDYFTAWLWQGGPYPFQMRAADCDNSDQVDIMDVTYLMDYLNGDYPYPCAYLCGDTNDDGVVDYYDVDLLVLFFIYGEPTPYPLYSGDVDCIQGIDWLDATYLSDYVSGYGPAPCDCDAAKSLAATDKSRQKVRGATSLEANYPNPFNPKTTIAYELADTRTVHLQIFDISGRLVRTLVDGAVQEAGPQRAIWNGADDGGRQVAAGVYFYRLTAGDFSEQRRMALIK